MNSPSNIYVLALFMSCVAMVSTEEIKEFYPAERNSLMLLRDSVSSSVDLHSNWTGPPCIDNLSRWVGVVCSNWHVVQLVLERIQLIGSLPPEFLINVTYLTRVSFTNNSLSGQLPNLTNLVHLQSVLLSHNRFSGSIPFHYLALPRLRQLELQENNVHSQIPPFDQPTLTDFNVSYNHLEGSIPKTDVLQRFPPSSYDHNLGLCGSPLDKPCPGPPPPEVVVPPPPPPPPSISPVNPPKQKKGLKVWNVILIAAAAALVPFLVIFVFLCYHKRVHRDKTTGPEQADGSVEWTEKRTPPSEGTEDPERNVELEFFNKDVPVFDLNDLLRASAEVLGKGKLGTTYKATMETGPPVVVKRLKNMNGLSKKEFMQQMQLLGRMKHDNLVQIISFYYSKAEKLLIYEYVPNGNLFDLLHENRGVGRIPLNWPARLSIIKDIAKGLNFLHQTLPSHKVPHANLKSTNVLVHYKEQNTYHSKLTDFGFLPLLPCRKSSEILAVARSPEFSQGKKLTHKADVYCFGIILLEIITGKIPGEVLHGNEETTDDLSDWVRTVVNTDWSTDILDVEIQAAREGHNEMLKLTELALECTDVLLEKRPKMCQVLRKIDEIIAQRNIEND